MSLFVSPFDRYRKRRAQLEMRVTALEECVGFLAHDPRFRGGREKAFNAQPFRAKIFDELIDKLRFDAIVETGTWLGNTTEHMATRSKLPVRTCELNPLYYALATMRLKEVANVSITHNDSRRFLESLTTTPLPSQRTLFYLDAHWHEDLPLADEIHTVAGHWDSFVVLIDDFEVPGDSGYGYDDYGKGKALDMATFAPVFAAHELAVYFPSANSSEEGGSKRGCVVLARNEEMVSSLDRFTSLRRGN